MTRFSREPLETQKLLADVSAAGHGAVASFLGVVRDNHDGKAVAAVTYDAFEPLAEKTLAAICAEAETRWKAGVAAAHRLGRLRVGEASVAIAAGSAHRAEAFEACRYVIEQIKVRLPVWKKEHYTDGGGAWLAGCALTARR